MLIITPPVSAIKPSATAYACKINAHDGLLRDKELAAVTATVTM